MNTHSIMDISVLNAHFHGNGVALHHFSGMGTQVVHAHHTFIVLFVDDEFGVATIG